jgi:cytochrome c553
MVKKTGGEHMLHIKNNIATGIAMAVLFMTPVACATTHPASSKAMATPAAPDATVKGAAAPSAVMADDSPEAIKLRSGPGDPVAGKDKSLLCQGCHGERGVSIEGMAPKLAGQYGIYIAKQVRNFQSGTRVHEIMSAVAQTVSDDDLADIAAYFASQEKMKGDGHDNELGKKLFEHGDMSRMMVACVNCHGVNGKGKSPDNPVFPVIGGQHKDYLRGQLINFRDGDRGNSPGGVMNIITQQLTDEELDALADYVSGR